MLGAKRLWINRELRVIALVILMAVAGTLLVRSHHLVPAAAMLAGAAAIGACFLLLVVRPARIPANSSLTLRLAGAIPEDVRRAPLEQLFRRNVIGMRQLRYGLEAIVTDRKVSTVLVQISGVEAGLATAHEIHRLLRAVAEAGKRVIAVLAGDSPTLSEYLIAAGASEVVLNPDAVLMMLGVAMGRPFIREAMDRIQRRGGNAEPRFDVGRAARKPRGHRCGSREGGDRGVTRRTKAARRESTRTPLRGLPQRQGRQRSRAYRPRRLRAGHPRRTRPGR